MTPERKNKTPMAMVIQVTVCSRYWMSRTPTMMAHTARNIQLCSKTDFVISGQSYERNPKLARSFLYKLKLLLYLTLIIAIFNANYLLVSIESRNFVSKIRIIMSWKET